MSKTILLIFILFLFSTISVSSSAQTKITDTTWDRWSFLIGNWKGEGSGQPGEGSGYFSFRLDLSGNILVRKSHSEYPPSNNKPAVIHDDLLIVYRDLTTGLDKAIYFDNEGHIINYMISFLDEPRSVICTSVESEDQPGFRLTYTQIEIDRVLIKFEFSPPNEKNTYKTYLEGTSLRVK